MAGVDGAPEVHCAPEPVLVTASRGPGAAEETEAGPVGEPARAQARSGEAQAAGPGPGHFRPATTRFQAHQPSPPGTRFRGRAPKPARKPHSARAAPGQQGVASPHLFTALICSGMFHLAGRGPLPPARCQPESSARAHFLPAWPVSGSGSHTGETKTQGESPCHFPGKSRQSPAPSRHFHEAYFSPSGKGDFSLLKACLTGILCLSHPLTRPWWPSRSRERAPLLTGCPRRGEGRPSQARARHPAPDRGVLNPSTKRCPDQSASCLLDLSWGNRVCTSEICRYLPGTRGCRRKGTGSRYAWGQKKVMGVLGPSQCGGSPRTLLGGQLPGGLRHAWPLFPHMPGLTAVPLALAPWSLVRPPRPSP